MDKLNIYYVEDSALDYQLVRKAMKGSFNFYPKPENWSAELGMIIQLLSKKDAKSLKSVEDLFIKYKVNLLILDQKIGPNNNSAVYLFGSLINNNEKFNNVKCIIFSGTTEKQDLPSEYNTDKLLVFPKNNNVGKAAKILKDIIIYILDQKNFWTRFINEMDVNM